MFAVASQVYLASVQTFSFLAGLSLISSEFAWMLKMPPIIKRVHIQLRKLMLRCVEEFESRVKEQVEKRCP